MIPQPWKEQQVTCQCLVLTALIRGSKLSSISKKAKDKSSHEISPEAAAAWEGDARGWAEGGSDASGPADFTAPLPSLGRGSTPPQGLCRCSVTPVWTQLLRPPVSLAPAPWCPPARMAPCLVGWAEKLQTLGLASSIQT